MTIIAKSPRRIPIERLNDAMLDLLKSGASTIDFLASKTGYAYATIRTRLGLLEDRGAVYRTRQHGPDGSGLTYMWHANHSTPVATAALNEDGEKPIPGELPRRYTTKNYAPIGRRDPLVAALFGQPGAQP